MVGRPSRFHSRALASRGNGADRSAGPPLGKKEGNRARTTARMLTARGESGSGTGRILQEHLAGIHPSLRVSAHLGSTEAVKRAVQAGLGISLVLASSVKQEVAAGNLAAIRIADISLEKQLYVIRDKDTPESSPARRFAEHLFG